jgi:pimeloyl-ACP methyl ester carboxylesterase
MKIAWEAQGKGAPLLLVQGLGYTRSGWGPAREALAQRYRVISFDNRGIGESEVPPGPYTVAQLAADAASVLERAGVARAHVVGASLGGMVAQEIALSYPDRVDRLVLACTTAGGNGSYPMPEQTQRLMVDSIGMEPRVALRRFVENALAPSAPTALADEIYAYRLANPPNAAGWGAQAAAGASWDAFERVGLIAAPTLVISGTHDSVVDARNSRLLAERIPNARLELIDDAGHMLFWERPGEFIRLVTEFLG